MYKKVISFILSVLMICSCTVFSYTHSTPVNVEYDAWQISSSNGEDETWYFWPMGTWKNIVEKVWEFYNSEIKIK